MTTPLPDLSDATAWPDDALDALRIAVLTEQERRQTLATYPDRVAAANASARRADPGSLTVHVDGDPYQPVTGYQDAYPVGAIVTFGGRRWQATQDGAWMEPSQGRSGWELLPEDGVIDAWVQPMAGAEYPPDAIVTHNGHTWQNTYGGPNGWEPGTTGAQWTQIDGA